MTTLGALNNSLASVVVPVYHEADTLTVCVAALSWPTVSSEHLEVIVLDDRPGDESAEVA